MPGEIERRMHVHTAIYIAIRTDRAGGMNDMPRSSFRFEAPANTDSVFDARDLK
jgi:hypothetical protein